MTKDEIKAAALRHGFTERQQPDGSFDLNPYVYGFALELISTEREATDLSQIDPAKSQDLMVTPRRMGQWDGSQMASKRLKQTIKGIEMHIIGIDPGANTGLATLKDGALLALETIEPHQIERVLRERMPTWVVFEDSRLQTHAWNARSKATAGAGLATARSLGQVDAWCSLITAVCAELGIPAHGVSPKGKGAKVDAARFAAITGWKGKSNEHTRDSAMVAWPYRRAVPSRELRQ